VVENAWKEELEVKTRRLGGCVHFMFFISPLPFLFSVSF
jgi:hypothetical protein